jgi:hypothetical protein
VGQGERDWLGVFEQAERDRAGDAGGGLAVLVGGVGDNAGLRTADLETRDELDVVKGGR